MSCPVGTVDGKVDVMYNEEAVHLATDIATCFRHKYNRLGDPHPS